ncbi:hypothetical protein FEM48_Zijuj01G0179000 [Ziziphus jujuba var. spinosa]|uniref:Uncharacterized protein n=1 Tax=Ziziphus jujuba var. spinosa TaxID=714518 RepID=A0A978W2Q2_ZIZJJ|nr:hypothetical protein FEM48_Zijuj01G0179000 [Ziziphus jujuba var. spinosa]
MGTAILRSQDCLQSRFQHETLILSHSVRSRRKPSYSYPTSTGDASKGGDVSQSRRRKRSPVGSQSSPPQQQLDRERNRFADRSMVARVPAKNLVMGQVKILKRGETLSVSPVKNNNRGGGLSGENNRKPRAKSEEDLDLVLGSTDRLGPDPEMVQKQIRVAEFKVVDGVYAGSAAFYSSPPPSSVPLPAFLGKNGAATSDLRRILGLDLA